MDPRRMVTALLDLVAPTSCAVCGLPGDPLCIACRAGLWPIVRPLCMRCGHPWTAPVTTCPECPPAIGWARQAVHYRDPVPTVVSAFKDHRQRALGTILASVMAEVIPRPVGTPALVPIPLGPARLADRGFNQASVIAEALGQRWNLPVRQALARGDDEAHQRGTGRAGRLRQVPGAFRVVGEVPLHTVLVDDVVTTGATLTAAARALGMGGCAGVGAVALARVVSHRGGTTVGGR